MSEGETNIKEVWLKLPDSTKRKVAARIADHFKKRIEEDSMMGAMEFLQWLSSDEGALVWPWLWRREYQDVMIDLAVNAMKLVSRLLMEAGSR